MVTTILDNDTYLVQYAVQQGSTYYSPRDRISKTRVFVTLAADPRSGINAQDDFDGPAVKALIRQYQKEHGRHARAALEAVRTEFDDQAKATAFTMRWSWKAGCSCGCSCGQIGDAILTVGRKPVTLYITVK